MKTIRSTAFAKRLNGICATAGLATLGSLSPTTTEADDYTHPEGTLPDSGNYIDFTIGYANPKGNEAAYLARHPIKKHAFGGIERFHYEDYIGRYTEFSVDGRALVDNNDYLLRLNFLNEDVGYLNIEWEKYRIWYDGSGDYFPGSDTFIELYDDELSIDRSKFEISGGLVFENLPNLEFSYKRYQREGLKSSTSLADTNLTGDYGTRNIVPTFWDIDESRDIFEITGSEKFGNTKAALTLRLEKGDTNNARKITRRPGESAERKITHREIYDSDLFSARATTITTFGEKTMLTTGLAYTEIDVNTTGSRIFGDDFDVPFDVDYQGQNRDHGWTNLMTDSQMDQWLLNANFVTWPSKHWKTIYSIRLEDTNTDIDGSYTETGFSTSTNTFLTDDINVDASRDWQDTALSAEAVYTGIEEMVFNAKLLYTTGDGDYLEEEFEAESGEQLLERLSNTDREVMKFSAGWKFYPSPNFKYFVQYYHKEKDIQYDHIIDPTEPDDGDRFPAFTEGQDFTTDDINVSVRWDGIGLLSGLSRIDYQKSKIDSLGQGLSWAHAYDREALILSQSLNVSFNNLFIQANIVYADDQRKSPVSDISGGVSDTIIVLDGDFWNGNVSANWAVDDMSSASVSLFANQTDNYVDNSEYGQPYGEDLTEYGLTATYTRKLSENMQITLRYSYFDSEDKASGGYNDYHAHVAYSTLRYRF